MRTLNVSPARINGFADQVDPYAVSWGLGNKLGLDCSDVNIVGSIQLDEKKI
jgi:hypothetical protein